MWCPLQRGFTVFKPHSGTGYCTEQQFTTVFSTILQTFSFFLFFVTTPRKMVKVSPVRRILQIAFYPSLRESPIKKQAPDNMLSNIIIFFASMKLYTSNQNHYRSFALIYCKIEIRFDIYGIEYVKSVFRGFKFVFSDFFPL